MHTEKEKKRTKMVERVQRLINFYNEKFSTFAYGIFSDVCAIQTIFCLRLAAYIAQQEENLNAIYLSYALPAVRSVMTGHKLSSGHNNEC